MPASNSQSLSLSWTCRNLFSGSGPNHRHSPICGGIAGHVCVPAGFFFQDGQWRGLKVGSPPAGSRGRGFGQGWLHFLRIMHKYFGYWDVGNICSTKNTLQHIRGGVGGKWPSSPLPMPAGAYVARLSWWYPGMTRYELVKSTIRRCSSNAWSLYCGHVMRKDSCLQKDTILFAETVEARSALSLCCAVCIKDRDQVVVRPWSRYRDPSSTVCDRTTACLMRWRHCTGCASQNACSTNSRC